jgi:hypothetical protein
MVQEIALSGQGRGIIVAVDDITRRIQRVTDDLRAIQEELGEAPIQDPAQSEPVRLLDELLEKDLINDFKLAVDHMRQFLWTYIDAVCRKEGRPVDYTLQAFRMQRVTEMLRIMRERVELPQIMQLPEAHSFFEEIQATADSALDRHPSPAKPPSGTSFSS